MMALFAELKRRNVVRVAGLYLVAAWFLTQVTSTLLPAFDLPSSILRGMVIVLALGFLPVLAFAWVFQLSPDGLQRAEDDATEPTVAPRTAQWLNRLFVALLLLSVGYFLVDKLLLSPRRDAALVMATTQSVTAEVTTQTEQRQRDRSIAVLPFVNMSDDKGNQYFSDGISEELLNVLLRIPDLSVASRTSSFAYRDQTVGTMEIARQLKVGHVLEGSVRKSGNNVRITAQLIDAVNDRHLWSETYDRELTDIFAIQDEISQAIVAELSSMLAASSAAEPSALVQADTANMQAYDLYLKARELFVARRDIGESVRLFEQVVAMDPQFARGWEGLAAASVVAPGWDAPDRDYHVLAKKAAQRALELDEALSLPYSVLGKVEQEAEAVDWAQVVALDLRAVNADDKNTTAYLWRGQTWWALGYFDRALADLDRCLAIDPAYTNCTRWKAQVMISAGDEELGLALFEQGVRSGFVNNRFLSFLPALVRRGDTLAAGLLLDGGGIPAELYPILLQTLAKPNTQRRDAAALVERHADRLGNYEDIMLLYLGDFESAAAAVIEAEVFGWEDLAWQPGQDAWRNSPTYKRLLNTAGVTGYWRQHGFPKQCRAVGAADFHCD